MIQELVDEYGLPRTSPGEMVEHVQRFYTGLYGCDRNDITKQSVFLDNINARLSDQQNSDLQLDLSEREIETAISQMAKGKAPGPDGLSIEFYTHCWPIVKDEVVSLLREMFSTQTIHPQIKTGYLTLIHKKGQKNEISNYRPISLLNYDLKILTKCLTNRIKTIIPDLTHEHQYAKPGKQISSATTLLRDLWWDVCNSKTDAYFISLDFQKAFDSIDQPWLFRVSTKFLNNLDVGLSDQQKEHLQNDLSVFEIETAISQMAKGKAPGPDGLSVEFYTRCWPIVKHDFVNILNQMSSTQSIDNKTKSGFITLIYKKGPKTKISNYRPISLLNYDLKIFTKCLTNRLKPFMTNLSHENQYAKPGKQIFSIANLLRDLWWDASDSRIDAYFVSLDFKKAFDSIDQRWLSRVLQKMNFPMKFIRTINSLNKDANVRVLVNGFRTKPVPINKGVRQGDPLSLYLFLLAVEPLVATINNDTRIEGLGKGRKRNVKCPSYADDLTLTLVGSPSVCLAFEIIERFSEATGLKLNMEKTQGMMVRSSCTDDRLPPINWQNQSIKILGFQIGNVNPRAIWHDSLEGLRKQKLLVNVPFQTWQAKSLLAKSKLLPQITYNAHTYPLDTTSKKLIQTEFLNYLTNNSTISLSMRSLQRPTNDGGIKFPNPTTYCDLFYISNLFQYFKTREKNTPFNTETYLIEFEIGLTLSKMYNLPKLNHIPHRDYPTPFYQKTLQILKEYEITLQELTNGKIRQIYNRISYPDKRPSRQEIFRWKLVFQNILPNYLKTFNYRTVRNLLPFNPEPGECALCLQFQDSAVHVFARCSITRQIWTILQDVFDNITETSFPLENLTPLNFFVPIQFENFTESIALILTVTNYCIWQTRKKQLNSDCLKMEKVKPNNVLAMIFNHIKTREKRENSLTDKTNYEITKNIRTEVGRILHNLFK